MGALNEVLELATGDKDGLLNAAWKKIEALSVDSKFTSLLQEVFNLHEKKGRDYGSDEDPLANCRASAEFGIPPWKGVAIRRADKWKRQKQFLRTGNLSNESFEDSLLDDAVYALIELILWRETQETGTDTCLQQGVFGWEKDE